MKRCLKCNCEINDNNTNYCPKCGEPIENKNNKKVIIIIFAVIGIILLFSIILGIAMSQLSKPKKEITLLEFKDYMEKNSCEVIENDVSDLGVTVHEVKENDVCKYNLSFINVDENNRENIYNMLVTDANNTKNITGRRESNNSLIGFYSYAVYGDNYIKIVLNKNMILVGKTIRNNRENLDKVFEDLGYGSIDDLKIIGIFYYSIYYIFLLGLIIILLVSLCKLFKKMNIHIYKVFIPFYNLYILVKNITNKKWISILLFIEYLVFITIIILNLFQVFQFPLYFLIFLLFVILYFILFINISINLALSFGKEKSFAILMVFMPYVGIHMLAFGNNEYKNNIKERND